MTHNHYTNNNTINKNLAAHRRTRVTRITFPMRATLEALLVESVAIMT